MKAKLIILAALYCSLTSCFKIEPDTEALFEMQQNSYASRAESNDGHASVRIGVYENIEGYNVSISDIRFNVPGFGSHISAEDFISSFEAAPTFDTGNGDFNKINLGSAAGSITICFDATVCAEDGRCSLEIQNVSYTFEKGQTFWKSGCSYSYVLCINEEVLGLKRITFNPQVNDFEEVNV
ncbi:MAG: hypothetical protein PUB45_02525 [Bacteroidales bacterium]|nr:hypothetical protein [Bacteroidales bacterium]